MVFVGGNIVKKLKAGYKEFYLGIMLFGAIILCGYLDGIWEVVI